MRRLPVPDTALVTTGLVYGYVRESNDDQMDPEGQMRDCRALAARYGYDPAAIEFVSDWGQSGRRLDRPGYVRIKTAIAAGSVVAVLARSVDRLGRDAQEVMAFEALALTHGTRVLTDRDGERTIDPDSVNTVVRWLPALLAQEESRLGRDRARRGRTTRLANMEAHIASCTWEGPGTATAICPTPQRHFDGVAPYGVLPGEDIEAVFDAFMTVGTYQGAARRLNALGVECRRGVRWESTSVMRIIRRGSATGRIALPARTTRRHRTLAIHAFARLLVCPHDNTILTATYRTNHGRHDVTYFCREGRQAAARCPQHDDLLIRRIDWQWDCPQGHTVARFDATGSHPRPWSVPERAVLPWAKAATAFVLGRATEGVVRVSDTAQANVALLQEQRRRIVRSYIGGNIEEQEHDTLIEAIDAELLVLQGAQRESATWTFGLDWSLPTADLNARLREVIHSVVLGPDMRPVGIVWTRQPTVIPAGEVLDMAEGDAIFAVDHPVRTRDGWYVPYSMPDADEQAAFERAARSVGTTPADHAGGTEAAVSEGKAAS
jgi:hypothetical protein